MYGDQNEGNREYGNNTTECVYIYSLPPPNQTTKTSQSIYRKPKIKPRAAPVKYGNDEAHITPRAPSVQYGNDEEYVEFV